MKAKIFETIKKFDMINEGDTIIVGVSGGADSISLLHFLNSNKDYLKVKLIAAHVNHCLRGNESDRDENFVREFCKQNQITFKLIKTNILDIAQKKFIGIEECGREERYKFFDSLLCDENFKVATAHTLSDSIETILLNLIRGSGMKGFCGIPAVRQKIIRPLISVTRNDVEEYCKENNLKFVIDTTNLSHEYTRNKIRLDVIPIFRKINPSFENCFKRMIETTLTENDYLTNLASEYIFKRISDINTLHQAIKSRVIVDIVRRKCGILIEKRHVDLISDMINRGSGAVNITGSFFVFINNGYLDVTSDSEFFNKQKNVTLDKWEIPISLGKSQKIDKIKIIIEAIHFDKNTKYEDFVNILKSKKIEFNNVIDYGTISKPVVLRNRRPGDFFVPMNRDIRKKLKNFFNEVKFPLEKRNTVALLACDNQILWIEGIGASDKCKVTKNTRNVLLIYSERR